jgi:hypothetical protein
VQEFLEERRLPQMAYLLNCECGRQLTVTAGAAGTTVVCECGRCVAVPSLSHLEGPPDALGVASKGEQVVPPESPPSVTPPVVSHAIWWRRREALLAACVLLGCGAFVGLLAGWSLGRRSEPATALALPGHTWRLKGQGKEPFNKDTLLEFREDGSLFEKPDSPPGSGLVSIGIGQYSITARDEITIKLGLTSKWRVGSGRLTVVMAGDNLVLESASNSDRLFLHRLQEADEPAKQSSEELRRQREEMQQERRHQEMMGLLRQIADRQARGK